MATENEYKARVDTKKKQVAIDWFKSQLLKQIISKLLWTYNTRLNLLNCLIYHELS